MRRWLVLVFPLVLFGTIIGGPRAADASDQFPDVPDSSPFHDDVGWMADVDITGGFSDGGYHPAAAVSRQSMAAFLHRLWKSFSEPEPDPIEPGLFTDVPDGHQFRDDISWMAALDITGGFPDGTFRPTNSVSRQSMAAFLHRFWTAYGPDDPDPVPPDPGFTDVSPTNPFYDDIAWMANLEITGGFPDGGYHPTAPVSRQSMAAFLHRTWSQLGFIVDTDVDTHDATPGDGTCADNSGDCSLRAAIDEANDLAGVDTILITPGINPTLSIAGTNEDQNATGDLDVRATLTIHGHGGTLDASRLDRVIDLRNGTLTIDHVVITGGRAGGFDWTGGGLRTELQPLVMRDSTVIDNESLGPVGVGGAGGGLDLHGPATIERTTITQNRANNAGTGGGMQITPPTGQPKPTVVDSIINDNEGGGVQVAQGPGVILRGVSITDNVRERAGGGLDVTFFTVVEVFDSTISQNTATGAGGGVHVSIGATVELTATQVARNHVVPTAGMDAGAGIEATGSVVKLDRSEVVDNEPVSGTLERGGGVHSTGTLTVTRSTIAGNDTGGGAGGGISNEGSLTVTLSTISDNSATTGGAIQTLGAGSTVLTASTLSSPTANAVAGAAVVQGTILDGPADLCSNDLDSIGFNLASDDSCGLDETTDDEGVDPILGGLFDNGGYTRTRLPGPSSPAIDEIPAGDFLCTTTMATDQRGLPRPFGGSCDIGAVEQ